MPQKLIVLRTLAYLLWAASLAAQPPTPKLQFEVASIKPADPAANPALTAAKMRMWDMMPLGMLPTPDPGRLRIQSWSLRQLIASAYRVRSDKVSGPTWMDDQRFDIEAKLPAGSQRDQANEMLQTLLADRFGLELHHESRELAGFALGVGKQGPKLEESAPPPPKPAEPLTPEESHENQKQKAQEALKAMQAQMQQRMKSGERMPGSRSSSWSSVAMPQFAEQLTSMAGEPVVDETGLTGKYKISIETWSATDDDPGQTIFEAVAKLGLKLTPKKLVVDVLVVDKLSKTPTAN